MAQRESGYARQPRDTYITPAWVTQVLVDDIKALRWQPAANISGARYVWEPAAGNGAMADVLRSNGYSVTSTDIAGSGGLAKFAVQPRDFLAPGAPPHLHTWIITNPPYAADTGTAMAFIERGLDIIRECNGLLALLLPVDFDSAKTRRHVFGGCVEFKRKLTLLDRIEWFDRTDENNAIKAENRIRKGAGLPPKKLVAGPSANHAWFIWRAELALLTPRGIGYAGKPLAAKARKELVGA